MKIKARRDRKHGTMSIEIRAENHREGLLLKDAVMGGMFEARVKGRGEASETRHEAKPDQTGCSEPKKESEA